MFEFINSLFPDGTTMPSRFDLDKPNIKYGVTTNISMSLSGKFGNLNDTRKNAFLGNSATLLGLCDGEIIADCGIYDGMCADIIGPNGVPDLGLADELMRKSNVFRTDIVVLRTILEENMDRANVVSPIYNMLRLLYIKKYQDLKYSGKDAFYDNGHIKVTNTQAFGDADEGKLGEAVSFKDAMIEVNFKKGGFNEYADTVYYNMGSKIDAGTLAVIKIAHAEWECDLPFNIAHSSPMLSENVTLIGARPNTKIMGFEELSTGHIKAAISEFVRRNSAYRDFEIAYGMMCTVMTRPIPRSAEAIYWSRREANVLMPKPYCIKGIMPELYSGNTYTRGPEWQDCFYSWFSNAYGIVGHSVALMEAVYVELFHLTRITEHADIDKHNFMQYAMGTVNAPNTGVLLDMALACMRYGKEYDARYLYRAGIDRIDLIPNVVSEELDVTVKDPEAKFSYNIGDIVDGVAPLSLNTHAPITYPSLSYGINEDQYYLNGDEEVVHVHCDPLNGAMRFSDPAEFSKFMSMMRLFGHDVVATTSFSTKKIRNWADNASGRYIYVHDSDVTMPMFEVRQKDIKQRGNSWISLPVLFGDITFKYTLGQKSLTWFSGRERLGFGEPAVTVVKRTEYVQAVAKMTQGRPTTKIVPVHRRADFHVAHLSMPATRPTLAPTSAQIAGGPLITDMDSEMMDPGPASQE